MRQSSFPHPTYGYFTEMEYGILQANNLSPADMKRAEAIKKKSVERKKAVQKMAKLKQKIGNKGK